MPYSAHLTMREARAQYFEDNAFGEDGGYGSPWVDFKIGPIPFPFPNTPMRVKAVRYHDLHHVLTGYATDFAGEMEIAAWEVGAGCGRFPVAWQLNLSGLVGGLFSVPRRSFRAFVRGRRSRSLYGRDLERLLDLTVAEAQAELSVPAGQARPRVADVGLYLLALAAGFVIGTVTLVLGLATLPLAYVFLVRRWIRARRVASGPASRAPNSCGRGLMTGGFHV